MAQLKSSKVDLTLELICAVAITGSLVFVLVNYNVLPDILPRHFNLRGEPDGFWSKQNIWFLLATTLVGYIGLTILGRYPKSFNYPYEITADNTERQYKNSVLMIRIVKTLIVLMFSYLTCATVNIGLGGQKELGLFFAPTALISILGTVVFFIIRGFKLR